MIEPQKSLETDQSVTYIYNSLEKLHATSNTIRQKEVMKEEGCQPWAHPIFHHSAEVMKEGRLATMGTPNI